MGLNNNDKKSFLVSIKTWIVLFAVELVVVIVFVIALLNSPSNSEITNASQSSPASAPAQAEEKNTTDEVLQQEITEEITEAKTEEDIKEETKEETKKDNKEETGEETNAAEAAEEEKTFAEGPMISTVDDLMLRTGPGTGYTAISKLAKGAVFYADETQNGWVHGSYNGAEGWVFGGYLEKKSSESVEKNSSESVDYSALEQAIENMNPLNITPEMGPYRCEIRGEDDIYVYYQAYAGGGWRCVKVTKKYPYSVEYMSDSEREMYEINPYASLQ